MLLRDILRATEFVTEFRFTFGYRLGSRNAKPPKCEIYDKAPQSTVAQFVKHVSSI